MYDKGVKTPKAKKYIYGTDKNISYDAAKHTLTLSGYDNNADGSYVKYSISSKHVFENYSVNNHTSFDKSNKNLQEPAYIDILFQLPV